jgi:hypothetical protein
MREAGRFFCLIDIVAIFGGSPKSEALKPLAELN